MPPPEAGSARHDTTMRRWPDRLPGPLVLHRRDPSRGPRMGDLGLASGRPDELLRGGVPSPCRGRCDVASAYPAVYAEELHAVGLLPEYPLTGRGQPQ